MKDQTEEYLKGYKDGFIAALKMAWALEWSLFFMITGVIVWVGILAIGMFTVVKYFF